MQSFGGLFCPLCLDYFVKPITTKCGHSFCEYCIDEYLLHFPVPCIWMIGLSHLRLGYPQ